MSTCALPAKLQGVKFYDYYLVSVCLPDVFIVLYLFIYAFICLVEYMIVSREVNGKFLKH